MPTDTSKQLERVELAPGFSICRAVTGLWQIADMERGGKTVDPAAAATAMQRYVEKGLTSFDMADHYGSAELITRNFLQANAGGSVQTFTKWVPDAAVPITREVVREGVQRSLDRMGVDCIDLLQFHWVGILRVCPGLRSLTHSRVSPGFAVGLPEPGVSGCSAAPRRIAT